MDRQASEAVTSLLQIVAIICVALILSMVLHKASTDVSALAWRYSGDEFCKALSKYLLSNLAGG